MAKYKSKPVIIEAEQFWHAANAPLGVFTRENGDCYVITIHGQETDIVPGDWIILEPGSNGSRAYPCKDDIFKKRYRLIEWEPPPCKCTCGCWGDPSCCSHHPDCPMKEKEG